MMKYADHEKWVIEGAESFSACAFRGRGQYEHRPAATLEEAKKLATEIKRDRPVMIYAIRGVHQVLMCTHG